MNWSEFLRKLMYDFRLSGNVLASKTGVTQPTLNRILNGKTLKPFPATIKQLEEGLNIKIDDRDPNNIIYKKIIPEKEIEEETTKLYTYPVLSNIYAGDSPMLFNQENISDNVVLPYHKRKNVFAFKVVGDSMNHVISEGDIILVDTELEVINNSIVVARLKNGKQLVKRFRALSRSHIMFYSDNTLYEPLIVPKEDIEAVFKVVGIWKKL